MLNNCIYHFCKRIENKQYLPQSAAPPDGVQLSANQTSLAPLIGVQITSRPTSLAPPSGVQLSANQTSIAAPSGVDENDDASGGFFRL